MKKETNRLRVKKKQIKEAVQALKEFHKKQDEENPTRKKPLLEDSNQSPVLLSVTLKKIPKLSNIQMIKVPLPHTLVTDTSEVCLITRDLDKRDRKADIEPTVQHYKELLSKYGVNSVSEIIPLRQLRTEYKPFEAKRKLYAAYDIFLCDNKITHCLPKVLGKFFFKKRKYPQQINLDTSNLKYQIENALSKTVFFLTGRGNSCSSEVAHLGLTTRQMVENIEAAINTLAVNLPGTWKNINGLYIKTPLSVSIPVYMSLESGNDVELPVQEVVDDVEAEEITTVKGYKVQVFPDGNIKLIKTEESCSSGDESDDDDTEPSFNKREEKKDVSKGVNVLKKKTRKGAVSVGKAKTMLTKRKVKNEEGEISTIKTETVLKEGKKLKKKINVSKTGTVLKKKKLDEDEVDEIKTVLKKKKLKVSK